MEILRELYEKLINTIPDAPPEVGVILGMESGRIDHYFLDSGLECSFGCYVPDIEKVNSVINDWLNCSVQFVGFAHTHHRVPTLSTADEEYIEEIMKAIQPYSNILYFPIIIPKKSFTAYSAQIQGEKLIVTEEKLVVL